MLVKQILPIGKALQSYSAALLNMVFPNLCLVCANALLQKETCMCRQCLRKLPLTNYHKLQSNAVERIFWGRVSIEHAAALFFYRKGEISQTILTAIKYKGHKELGEHMGQLMGETLKESTWLGEIDYLVPVPLHPRKQRSRGFNQSDIIAKGISRAANIPIERHLLIRKTFTDTQTRKGRFDRFTNMKNAFAVHPNRATHGQHYLLIDDVVTTGGTLEACAIQLLSIPNAKVSILTLGYASQ